MYLLTIDFLKYFYIIKSAPFNLKLVSVMKFIRKLFCCVNNEDIDLTPNENSTLLQRTVSSSADGPNEPNEVDDTELHITGDEVRWKFSSVTFTGIWEPRVANFLFNTRIMVENLETYVENTSKINNLLSDITEQFYAWLIDTKSKCFGGYDAFDKNLLIDSMSFCIKYRDVNSNSLACYSNVEVRNNEKYHAFSKQALKNLLDSRVIQSSKGRRVQVFHVFPSVLSRPALEVKHDNQLFMKNMGRKAQSKEAKPENKSMPHANLTQRQVLHQRNGDGLSFHSVF